MLKGSIQSVDLVVQFSDFCFSLGDCLLTLRDGAFSLANDLLKLLNLLLQVNDVVLETTDLLGMLVRNFLQMGLRSSLLLGPRFLYSLLESKLELFS